VIVTITPSSTKRKITPHSIELKKNTAQDIGKSGHVLGQVHTCGKPYSKLLENCTTMINHI
jgi:hypothetical protein